MPGDGEIGRFFRYKRIFYASLYATQGTRIFYANLISGDKIQDKLESADDPFPAKDILKIAYEIVKGLEYLHHTAHILHGDVKSYNILVSDDYNTVKLCDFGVSLPLTESLEMDTSKGEFMYVGTECWSAPEIIHGWSPF